MMENTNKIESGYKILNILLVAEVFKREANVTFDIEKIKHDFDIKLDIKIDEQKLFVSLTVVFKHSDVELKQVQVSAEITYIGAFERFGSPEISTELFANVNAPAIIFPYLREHLTSLTSKAGLGLVVLQPVNFAKKFKEELDSNK